MFTFWKFFERLFDGEKILENKQEDLEAVGTSRALFWSFNGKECEPTEVGCMEERKQIWAISRTTFLGMIRAVHDGIVLQWKLRPWPSNAMECGPPGSSDHWILQTRILEGGCHALQGILLTQQLTPVSCFLHWQMSSLSSVPPGKRKLIKAFNVRDPSHIHLTFRSSSNAIQESAIRSWSPSPPLGYRFWQALWVLTHG